MDEYQRRVAAHDSVSVTAELLQHIADGGLRAFHFRTACQMCDWPAPNGADITIGLLGIPNGEYFLVIARDEETDTRLKLSSVAPKLATESQVSHRETVVEAVADTRAGVRRKLMEEMQSTCRFGDLSYILAWLANCSLCGECLKACPLFESPNDHSLGNTSSEGRSVLTELVKLSRWLAVCVGCGMCAEACPGHVPLTLLISGLGHRIREEIHYCAGDPAQRLPWLDR
jgi:ferredoxin